MREGGEMVGCHLHVHLLPSPAIASAAAELPAERGGESFGNSSSAASRFQRWRILLFEAVSDHAGEPCVQAEGGPKPAAVGAAS